MPRYAVLPNLMPARLDLVVYRGDSLSVLVRIQHRGQPLNIAGFDFEAHIRLAEDDVLVGLIDIEHVSDEEGKLRLILPTSLTQQLFDKHVWDLQATEVVEEGSGAVARVRTLLRGDIHNPRDVTHPETIPIAAGLRRGMRRA